MQHVQHIFREIRQIIPTDMYRNKIMNTALTI